MFEKANELLPNINTTMDVISKVQRPGMVGIQAKQMFLFLVLPVNDDVGISKLPNVFSVHKT